MKDNKRKNIIIIALLVIGILSITIGVTYSFFNYARTGLSNNIGTGRIYFNSTQNGRLQLSNIFPVKASEVDESTLDSVSVNVLGDTTYTDGEEFQITLVDVNNTVNGKKIPINYIATYTANTDAVIGTLSNDYWNARESKDDSIYLLNETGEVEEGKQVLVGYIDNGATGINGTLTIKAYIDADRIAISDTYDGEESDNMGTTNDWVEGRTVFTTTEWNSFQNNGTPISFKIRAESNEGIWVNKPATPASCFTTETLYIRNPNMNVSTCVSKFTEFGFNEYLQEGETLEAFCQGTGTVNGNTFQEALDNNWFFPEELTELESDGIILQGNETTITGYDASCGSDVVIPSSINAASVTTIGNDAFSENQLTSVTIPNSVTTIGEWAFASNQLTSVTIPNSVTTIANFAFSDNQLPDNQAFIYARKDDNSDGIAEIDTTTIIGYGGLNKNVTIPNSVTTIGEWAFASNQLTSVTIPNSVTTIGNYAFSHNQLTSITIPNSVINTPWDNDNVCYYFDGNVNVTWNNQTITCAAPK